MGSIDRKVWGEINENLFYKDDTIEEEREEVPKAEHRVESDVIINPVIGVIDDDEYAYLLQKD